MVLITFTPLPFFFFFASFTNANFAAFLAFILPPLGVFLERGCNSDLLINVLLTCLGWFPGIIHALYIIFKY
jgi:uncharacterized membrane protein YqaE (UPF0057 family)